MAGILDGQAGTRTMTTSTTTTSRISGGLDGGFERGWVEEIADRLEGDWGDEMLFERWRSSGQRVR